MNEMGWTERLRPYISLMFAIIASFTVGAFLLWILGINPLRAYQVLFEAGLGKLGITQTLVKMTPLLMISAGLMIVLSAGIWNLGEDGQFLIGAILVGVAAPIIDAYLPKIPALLILGMIGFLGGAAWAIIPAVLRIWYGLNEIITTIMTDYLAIYLTSWLVKGPFRDPSVIPPQTPVIPLVRRIPQIWGGVHIGLIIGVVAVLGVHFLMRNSTIGWKILVVGKSIKTAVHTGIPVARLSMMAFLLSAGFAGLAGANGVLGVKGLFQGDWNPAYGFTAFALVYMARFKGGTVIFLAYFFSFLLLGGEMMSLRLGTPVFFVTVLEGLMLIFFVVNEYLLQHVLKRRRS